MEAETIPDLRGRMTRGKRLMPDVEARAFLREKKIANIGTVDRNGWPYVVPLTYIYEGGEQLYFHTGGHQGHFLTNLEQNPKACLEVSEIGPLHKGQRFACDSALVYTSVVVFGTVKIIHHDRDKKAWFLDQLLAKHGDPSWTFEPGYPLLDQIILYEQKIEVLTGKHSSGIYH